MCHCTVCHDHYSTVWSKTLCRVYCCDNFYCQPVVLSLYTLREIYGKRLYPTGTKSLTQCVQLHYRVKTLQQFYPWVVTAIKCSGKYENLYLNKLIG